MPTHRPKSIVAAIVLLVFGSLMVFLPVGGVIDLSDVPPAVIYGGYAFGALGLLAAWLLWSSASRLGWWLGLIICLLDGLGAAPGILFADDPRLRAIATLGTFLRFATVLALLWPSSRAAVRGSAEQHA